MSLAGAGFHNPASDGRPSGVRGAGADRSARPFGKRGIPAVGTFSHWPCSDTAEATASTSASNTRVMTREGYSSP